MSHTFEMATYRLMREHAGYSHAIGEDPERARVRCALELARAWHALQADPRVYTSWVEDPEAVGYSEEVGSYVCQLWAVGDNPYPLDALHGIDVDAGHPYRQVVEAELYSELEYWRERVVCRGEN